MRTRYVVLGFLGVILSANSAAATTIEFDVPAAFIGPVFSGADVDLSSSGLDGIVLEGQTLSLDLVLANAVLARLLLLAPDQLGIGLGVFTNAGTFPGLAGPTTGFALDPDGGQLGGTQEAGRTQSSNGAFFMGLVSFSSADFGGAGGADISGVHFDTTFPDTGFVVTDLQLRFSLNNNRVQFGTAEQLPEPATLVLVLTGVLALLVAHRARRSP